MDKLQFILAQYKRTFGKKYENYCIERIINKVNNPELIFITQKMFRRKNGGNANTGGIALADLYFPQLRLTVEIDEAHHINNAVRDANRTKDILDKLSKLHTVVPFEPEELRICAYSTDYQKINKEIDKVVDNINERIKKLSSPLSWEFLTVTNIKNSGKLETSTDFSFPTIYDVSVLFNKNYKKRCQRCYFPVSDGKMVWCPKLMVAGIQTNVVYGNEISTDEKIIYEYHKDQNKNDAFVSEYVNNPIKQNEERYVFGYYETDTGEKAYVFKGIYKFNLNETKNSKKRVWEKISDTIDLGHF